MLTRLSGRYGRRGAWLIVLGVVWMLFGVGIFLEPTDPRPWVLWEYLPQWVQACAWWLTGAVAVWQGLQGRQCSDAVGHVALYVVPLVRLGSFVFSWLVWLGTASLHAARFDVPVLGWPTGWYAAAVWSVVLVMLRLVQSWPNPERPIPHPPAGAVGAD